VETLATYGWRTNRPLSRGLVEESHLFEFFQAVRLLEVLGNRQVSVGEGVDPSSEAVRFSSNTDLRFHPSDIESIQPGSESTPARMTVNFLGLAGTNGPLPRSFSEEIHDRKRRKDAAAADFLDIFNHRLVSLFYRARRRFRLALHWGPPELSRIAQVLLSLFGLKTEGLQDRLAIPDRSLLVYAGLLARQARSMVGIRQMLEHYFQVPVEIEPLQGRWHVLSADQWTLIGRGGRNRTLGRGAVLGTRAWDQAAAVALEIGPVGFGRFCDFLPVGRAFGSLQSLTQLSAGDEFDYHARLTLVATEVPALHLGSGARLGWTTWLKTREFTENDRQVRFKVNQRNT
jgi:type VI secretion system protein ImpH